MHYSDERHKYTFKPLALTGYKTKQQKREKTRKFVSSKLSGSRKMSLCIGIGCAAPVTVHWPCARVDGACNSDFFSKSFCYYYEFQYLRVADIDQIFMYLLLPRWTLVFKQIIYLMMKTSLLCVRNIKYLNEDNAISVCQ